MGNTSSSVSSVITPIVTPSSNVVFIAYNSTITGSKALRVYNEMNSTQELLYKNDSENMVKSYCENYDKAKKNEPFYDVIASQIATLNQKDFDNNFTYCPVDLVEEGNNMNSFHPSQSDPLVFKMTSKSIEEQETFTRDNFNDYYKYSNPTTEHIFIYGPITDTIYENMEVNMLKHYSNNTQLIIHLQGENYLDNQGNDGDIIFGMESKGNLFKNAFNYQNCMKNAQKLRNFIQSKSFCEAFTVICTSKERETTINKTPLIWKNRNGTTENIIGGLPQIYIDFYNDISYLLKGELDYTSNYYQELNITNIYQDMVDKDNSSSIVFLILKSRNEPKTHLIGREAFRLLYKGKEIPHYQSLNWSNIPEVIKPDNISQDHKNIDLDMSKTTTTYWPAFKDINYKLKYSPYDTVNHYILMNNCFKLSINNLLEFYYKKYDNFNTSFSEYIACPSDIVDVPLMNEIIFFPALNTLIKSVNSIDSSILKEIHPNLSKIISNQTYLNNDELSDIYTDYLNKRYSCW